MIDRNFGSKNDLYNINFVEFSEYSNDQLYQLENFTIDAIFALIAYHSFISNDFSLLTTERLIHYGDFRFSLRILCTNAFKSSMMEMIICY